MKRIIALLFTLTFFSSLAFSQKSSKFNFSLTRRLKNERLLSKEISLLVQGDVKEIKRKTEELGGVFKYSIAGIIAAVQLPLNKVHALAELNSVVRIEDNGQNLQVMNDQMIIKNHVWEVQQGFNLPQGYDGTGVVMGIIDEGIDFTHPDFRDVHGNTRIKYVWDQTSGPSSMSPVPYAYGREWVGSQIDTSTLHHDGNTSHGSHVAGTACGNGLAVNNYKGVAPNADIIIVKMEFNQSDDNLLTNLVDAVKYIYDKADLMNEPAVLNLSLGTYFGSHDGKDIQAVSIDNQISAHPGRSLVCAAGNAGAAPIHLGYNVNSDTAMTWLQFSNGPIYLELWSDSADFANVHFSMGVDRVQPDYKYLGGLPFLPIQNYIAVDDTTGIYFNGNRIGIIETFGEYLHGAYLMQFLIMPDSTYDTVGVDRRYLWRFMATGTGHLDAWSFNMVADNIPDPSVFPPVAKYKVPNTDQTIASSFTCSDKVITVGSYANRNTYANSIFGQTTDPSIVPGRLSSFSSRGPTRDGRIKPDVSATGEWVLSCGAQSFVTTLSAVEPQKVAAGKKHFRSNGTSMSSPVVAGIAALYLQKNPTATYADVKNAILTCADQDVFTGSSLPDNKWGNGKVNGYSVLHGCAVGIHENDFSGAEFSVFPNPFIDEATVHYDLSSITKFKKAEFKICDLLGHEVRSILLNEAVSRLVLRKDDLRAGVYFCTVVVDGKILKTSKLVIL